MRSEIRKKTVCIRLLLAFLIGVFSGCGGGSSDSDTSEPPPSQNADGIWQGTTTDDTGTCKLYMINSNGEMVAFSSECQSVYKGSYTVDGANLAAQVEVYDIGGAKKGSTTLSGTCSEQSTINGSYTTVNGSGGTFDLSYNPASGLPSSFQQVAGTWSYSTSDDFSADVVIDNQGKISGANSYGCNITGVISLLDTNRNIYSIDLDITQCTAQGGAYDQNGSFDGLAVIGADPATKKDMLIIVSASGNDSLLYPLTRQ